MLSPIDSFLILHPYFFSHYSFKKRSHVILCLTDITRALFSTWSTLPPFFMQPLPIYLPKHLLQRFTLIQSDGRSSLSLPEYRVHSVTFITLHKPHSLAVIDTFVSFSLWDIISSKPASVFFSYTSLLSSIVPDR